MHYFLFMVTGNTLAFANSLYKGWWEVDSLSPHSPLPTNLSLTEATRGKVIDDTFYPLGH